MAAFSVLMAPSAAAAPSATIEIRNLTPPVASVDAGGSVTFVNKIPAQNKGGINLGLVNLSVTVHTDVAVNFFGQERKLATDQSAAWNFSAPATTGSITYTYRIVPQASLPVGVTLQQVVDKTLASLPPLPAPIPYVVQTIAPNLPTLPSVGLPQLPQVNVPLPTGQVQPPPTPGGPTGPAGPGAPAPTDGATDGSPLAGTPGDVYTYDTDFGAPRMTPSDIVAASAFDPSRYFVPGRSLGGADRAGSGGGAGGVAGSYDGASVPVFGQLAGLDDVALEESDPVTQAASEATPAQTLPAAALAAVVALAAVTAALVRTHQASRSPVE
ncbi:hypothetical protein [Blastococcus haudaquaticus]|uniref:Uncharacterized protein n=1 Tax=Blastococcus haudaquaticus TaxID=1938745 RepID=A0A286GJ19_9ACTN|nr:hypothetical protein [Blastococcus haudaquaticus]SOD95472.1 hypothetical protein SAMN06272739_1222 [Blastococcus haudaquaticus]